MVTKEKIMTTQEIANRLVELCRQGQFEEAQKELYAENAESIEPESATEYGWDLRVKGLDKIFEKGEKWANMVDEYHELKVSEPLISKNCFAISAYMDLTMKGMPRDKMEELCVYKVKDGKVISEQFFF